jgi:ectoine hydroxylase
VAWARAHCEHVHVECEPGDAFFMHANTLHASAANQSGEPRWALICCYNTRRNSPWAYITHPPYSPLDRWADEEVLALSGTRVMRSPGR